MFPYILQALYMPKDRPLDSTPERSSGDMHTKQKTGASNLALDAEHLLEGEEFPIRNSKGDTPEMEPPVSARVSIYSIFSICVRDLRLNQYIPSCSCASTKNPKD